MLHRIVVAIGAGCAAALLFVVSAQTSVLAMTLAYLAPLPIMIATLGWGLDVGAVSAGISVTALAVLAEPLSASMFAASVAGPAWALAAFAITPVARYFKARKSDAPRARLRQRRRFACVVGRNCRRRFRTDNHHCRLRRLPRCGAPSRRGAGGTSGRRFREFARGNVGARIRGDSHSLRSSRNRWFDAFDALHQSLWRGARGPTVPSLVKTVAGSTQFTLSALAGGGLVCDLRRRRLCPA